MRAPDEHAVELRVLREVPALRELAEPYAYLGRHSRSFRFAAALLRVEPPGQDARAIHRFRRASEPWALEALAFVGASELGPAVEEARASDPAEPLLRGDELDLPPGPESGRLLAEIEEERAAGTIATKEEALDYARRNAGAVRQDG